MKAWARGRWRVALHAGATALLLGLLLVLVFVPLPDFGMRFVFWWLVCGAGVYLGLLVPLYVVDRTSPAARRARNTARGLCPECGYDLKGELGEGCPECGWNKGEGAR